MKNYLILVLCFTVIQIWTFGQDSQQLKIDSLILSKMKKNRIIGLSVGIVIDGEHYYSKGYGYTSTDKNNEVTDNTVFLTASITKVFTASAIMQFVERGEIKLTDKLIDHLPDFTMRDKRYKQITIEHLLTHTSGLPWEHKFKKSPDDSTALEQFVADMKKEKLKFTPGEKFDGTTYSNAGYSILGLIIQRKSGMSYDAYIQKHLLHPNKMFNCYFDHEEINKELKAQPLILSGKSREIKRFNLYGIIKDQNPVLKYPEKPLIIRDTYGRTEEHNPVSALITSTDNLSIWMEQLIKIYSYSDSSSHTNTFISSKNLKDMWSLKYSINNSKTSIGLGWWRYADPVLGDYVFHVGREPGFSSTLIIFTEKKVGITILCNGKYADQIVWNELPELILKVINNDNNNSR